MTHQNRFDKSFQHKFMELMFKNVHRQVADYSCRLWEYNIILMLLLLNSAYMKNH